MEARGLIGVHGRSALALAASTLALGAVAAQAPTAQGSSRAPRADGASAAPASATLEDCETSSVQAERSATFAGEMTAVAGTVRMAMRIDLEERTPEQSLYHTVSAPGLGIWRLSDPRVKIYKYLKRSPTSPRRPSTAPSSAFAGLRRAGACSSAPSATRAAARSPH